MKLEHTLTRFVSLGPKIYGGIDENSQSFTKIKGLKNKINFNQLENLLNNESFNNEKQFTQEKWYKSFSLRADGTIEIKQVPYLLRPTPSEENKRILISPSEENNQIVGTKSIELKDGKRMN